MPLTEGFVDTTVCLGFDNFLPEELISSLSLFSMTSMFHFLTQICLNASLDESDVALGVEYSPFKTGCWPTFSTTLNSTSGYCLANFESLRRKNSLIPAEEPPKLQYVMVIRLHGRTNAPTPLRARDTCCTMLIPTIFVFDVSLLGM